MGVSPIGSMKVNGVMPGLTYTGKLAVWIVSRSARGASSLEYGTGYAWIPSDDLVVKAQAHRQVS
jgi:hypothetical protein